MYVAVGDAQLWVEDEGNGPAILFLHGGLGDSRLWAPVAQRLADAFRCIRYDFRFYGRSRGPGAEWSSHEDAVGVLDALGVERAALVGLSIGGRIALETAQLHPERVTAVVHVAGAAGPFELDPQTEAAYEAASSREEEMEVDFRVWAPLGVEASYRELWLATPDESQLPDGAQPRRVELRLDQITRPVFVVTAKHDPPAFRAVADGIPAARRAEVDSDHYLTLREPDTVARLIRDFLGP